VRILVDGEAADEAVAGGEALTEVYLRVVGELAARGRTVVGVSLDGRTLTQEDQTKVLDGETLGEALDLRTVSTRELATATLGEVAKHVDRARKGLRTAVERLGAGDRTEALAAFQPTLEIWMAVCEAVQKVCIVSDIDITADLAGTSVAGEHGKIVDALGDVQSALAQQDWVKLADVLEYEMLPATERWRTVVTSLLEKLQSDGRA